MDPIIANSLELCRILKADHARRFDQAVHGTSQICEFELNEGRKYLKVVQVTNIQHFAHCFIDRNTGDVYKAASYAQPAKGIRYNILRDMDILRNADWAGGYLYKR